VEFIALGEDRAEIVLTHEGFADGARMGRHDEGWTQLLRLLAGFIDGHSGQGKQVTGRAAYLTTSNGHLRIGMRFMYSAPSVMLRNGSCVKFPPCSTK
jgi:hypothetical protein